MSSYEESGKRRMIKLEIKPGTDVLNRGITFIAFFLYIFSSPEMCLGRALATQSESLSVFDENQNILWETGKIATKEVKLKKKQIQTILSATHTVTVKLQEGKTEVAELMWFCSDLGKKHNRSCYKDCVDARGANSDALIHAE